MAVAAKNARVRRLARATARVIRPGTRAAAALDRADDAWWEQLGVADRVRLAFQLSVEQWRLHGWRETRLAKDFRDLLRVFVAHEVRFLVVGAYALAVLGRPRATGDLDVWVDPTPENAERAFAALRDFGTPLHELRVGDLARRGIVFQIGLPPLRIDVLTAIDGVVFSRA